MPLLFAPRHVQVIDLDQPKVRLMVRIADFALKALAKVGREEISEIIVLTRQLIQVVNVSHEVIVRGRPPCRHRPNSMVPSPVPIDVIVSHEIVGIIEKHGISPSLS